MGKELTVTAGVFEISTWLNRYKPSACPLPFWDFAKKRGNDYEVVKLLKLLGEHGLQALLAGMEAAASVGSYAYEAF